MICPRSGCVFQTATGSLTSRRNNEIGAGENGESPPGLAVLAIFEREI
jgi:hypothetical protein